MGKSKAETKAVLTPASKQAQWQSIMALQELMGAFPQEWYAEEVDPALAGYMSMLQGLGAEGVYDPEVMQRVFQTAIAPGLELERRGIQNLLGQQVAKGVFRPATQAETAAKAAQAAYGKGWQQVPELALKDIQTRLQGLEGLKSAIQVQTAPETWKKGVAEALGGVGAAYPAGTTTKQPRSLWGIPLG